MEREMKFVEIDPVRVRPCAAWAAVLEAAALVQVAPTGPWICGGSVRRALRNEPLSDIDVFVPDEVTAMALRARIGNQGFSTDLATSHKVGKLLIQVVTVTMAPTMPEVLSAFDFNEAAVGYDGLRILVAEEGLLGLLRGHLSINLECRGQFPAVTARRIVKYAAAGLHPCQGTMVDLLKMAGVDTSKLEVKYVD